MSSDQRPPQVIEVGSGFSNIRGSFKVGPLDIGTHASLVRLASGKLVLLDACDFTDETSAWIAEQTRGGDDLEAILHLHPFHTLHVHAVHARFPGAALYGTARHRERYPELPWQALGTEDPELHALFADDFDFTVPRGVDFISANDKLHFSSVLAIHRASRTLHVDDTLLYFRLPWPARLVVRDVTRFHPTLAKVLERRPGAAADFRAWARELIDRAHDLENLCAAHGAVLRDRKNRGPSIAERIERAAARLEPRLRAHERDREGAA
jgi:hypothetical protein